ncbi:MAG: TatD family hydrolase [Fibrobacter sp.]|nr:TatD family hydrolase [Fibrobacter sp.]
MNDFHLHLTRLPHFLEVKCLLEQMGIHVSNVACEPWEWEKSIEMGYFFGIHPMIATKINENDCKNLYSILKANPKFGVGECGIDKRFEGYNDSQANVFARQAQMAIELNRDIQIHCVGDYHRIIKILKEKGFGRLGPRVIFHRFGGDISVIKKALELNALFSLHKDSFAKKSTLNAILEARNLIADKVFFETDADETFSNGMASPTPEQIAEKIKLELQANEKLFRGVLNL